MLHLSALMLLGTGLARPVLPQAVPSKVIFDTDIGDDIDDAYALGLLLRSPEVKVLGVTTAFQDTHFACPACDAIPRIGWTQGCPGV